MNKSIQIISPLMALALVGCGGAGTGSSSITGNFAITFKNQSLCGKTSVADNVSVYLLNDDNEISDTLSVNSSGVASTSVSGDTVSFMVVRTWSDNGADIYLAKDISPANLGTWYFDTHVTDGCSCQRGPSDPVQVTVKTTDSGITHINWPYTSRDASTTSQVDYKGVPICQFASAQDEEPLLVAFARESSQLTYVTLSNPTEELSSSDIITVNTSSDTAADSRSLDVQQDSSTAVSSGQFFYVSDDIYEFHADFNSSTGAKLLTDTSITPTRIKPIRFATSTTKSSGSPSIEWSVNLPLSQNTSALNFSEPDADDDTLKALVQATQTSFDFSSDDKQNATVESFTVTNSGFTDHWTVVQNVKGNRLTVFNLPAALSSRSASTYGDSISERRFAVVDFVDFDGYLYSDQGSALRELFSQSDANTDNTQWLDSLQQRGWQLDFEVHEYAAEN